MSDGPRVTDAPLLAIGRVAKARGVRGEVVVRLANESSRLLDDVRVVYVAPKDAPKDVRRMSIRATRSLGNGWGVSFEGVSDRDEAESLRGATVSVPWDALPQLDEDEFYYEQIRGYTVALADGRRLGEVAGTFETNVDILVVKDRETGREYLIPVVEDFVPRIDHEARRIEVAPPEGLLDLE